MDTKALGGAALDVATAAAGFMLPPLAPVAALLEPALKRWIFGAPTPQAQQLAQAAHDVVATVAGVVDPVAAQAAVETDPAKAASARQQLGALAADAAHQERMDQLAADRAAREAEQARLETMLADLRDARARDAAVTAGGGQNWRADLMLAIAGLGLLACIGAALSGRVSDLAMGLIASLAGTLAGCLKDAFGFEFGSSRSSDQKSAQLASAMKMLAQDTVPARLMNPVPPAQGDASRPLGAPGPT